MNAQLKMYLKAVTDLLEGGADFRATLKDLEKVMVGRGHKKLYLPVLRILLRTYPQVVRRNRSTLIVAKEEDAKKYKAVQKSDAELVIDHTIVGGYIHTEDFVRKDNSYKTKLLTWYRRATTVNR